MARATWFCVDIECSGPVPGLYDMVSIGVVAVTELAEEWMIGERFYAEIKPTAPHVDPGAMAVAATRSHRGPRPCRSPACCTTRRRPPS